MSELFVGNDIVAFGEPRTVGRSGDDRFVDRVFDPDERAAIRAATDGDVELWARWAAKETGFKVISKLIGRPPTFAHRAFKVVWTDAFDEPRAGEGDLIRVGLVTYEGHTARVSVATCSGGVHAIGFGAPGGPPSAAMLVPRVAALEGPGVAWEGSLEDLQARFTPREFDAVYSLPSAAVRLGARAQLANALGVVEERIEIVCDPGTTGQRPPRVLLDGERTAADVSLSHDGAWIAWVTWTDNAAETV